jgi:hypothetical protein
VKITLVRGSFTRTFLTAPLAVAVLLAGCGGGGESADRGGKPAAATSGTATNTPATTTASGTTSASNGALAGADTKPVVVAAANDETALLTAVRAARHDGYDRAVFEFRNALPGYDVRYVERPIRQDGSGNEVTVDGAFVAQIKMQNALDADLSKPSAPATYTGPTRLSPALPQLVELTRTGGFEAVLTWVAGLRSRTPFRVTTLQAPPRLVVDFASR